MSRKLFAPLAIVVTLGLAACGGDAPAPTPPATSTTTTPPAATTTTTTPAAPAATMAPAAPATTAP